MRIIDTYSFQKFTCKLMVSGKKQKAEGILKKVFDNISKQNKDPIEVFNKALKNTKPILEVRSKRKGTTIYQIPVPITEKRQISLGISWIIDTVRKKSSSRGIILNLTDELLNASEGKGLSVQKKLDLHKVAKKNRAYTHFRWF